MGGRIKPDENGRFWGPSCRQCKEVKDWATCRPVRIQTRSINNARKTQEWYFCSPECLVEFVSVGTQGQGVLITHDEDGYTEKKYNVSDIWLKEMYD